MVVYRAADGSVAIRPDRARAPPLHGRWLELRERAGDPQLAIGGYRFTQKPRGVFCVTSGATRKQHASAVLLRMREPRTRADATVYLRGVLEVTLRVVPARLGRREKP